MGVCEVRRRIRRVTSRQLVWDAVAARPTATIDANGLSTLLQFDGLNRPTRQTRPDGTATVISRTLCGSACAWPGTYRVVTVTERGVGDAHIKTRRIRLRPQRA